MKMRWWFVAVMIAAAFVAWSMEWYDNISSVDPGTGEHHDFAYRLGYALPQIVGIGIAIALVWLLILKVVGPDSRLANFPLTVRSWANSHPWAAVILGLWALLVLAVIINSRVVHNDTGSSWMGSITVTVIALLIIVPITRWIDRRHARVWSPTATNGVAAAQSTHSDDGWTFVNTPGPIVTSSSQPAPEQRAAFCPNCGSRLVPGQKFCAECGAPAGVVTTSGGS